MQAAKLAEDIGQAVVARLRQTARGALADMLGADKVFMVLLYGEDYGHLRECRAQYAPYAEVHDLVEVNHPEAGPALGVIMLPKPGMTIEDIVTKIHEE